MSIPTDETGGLVCDESATGVTEQPVVYSNNIVEKKEEPTEGLSLSRYDTLLGQMDDPEIVSQIVDELCDVVKSKQALVGGLAAQDSELRGGRMFEDMFIVVDRIVEEEVQRRSLANERHPSKLNLLWLLERSCWKDPRDLKSASGIKELIMLRALGKLLIGSMGKAKSNFFAFLGASWLRRFEKLGDVTDIEKAIEAESLAAQLTPDDHPDNPAHLSSLGALFHCRFKRLGELKDIEKAIECEALAVKLTPDGHPDKPSCLNNLGSSWLARFERLGELKNVERAIECQSLAVKLTPDGHSDKPSRLNNLGNSWYRRFERLGELADVEKAIEYQSLAVKLTPDGHPDTPSHLNSLGSSWSRRFEQLGELPDVEKAIEYQSLAVQPTSDGRPVKPAYLSNLGSSWLTRFERLGELADVEKAIEFQSLAVKLTPGDHCNKPGRLSNLGSSWYRRFERLGELPDVEKAIEYQSLAVKLTPDSHPDKSNRLNNLGSSWYRRFERLGELPDVEKAIEYQSLAAQLTHDSHPEKPSCLSNLGSSWLTRFERLGELEDIEKSIQCKAMATQLTPDDHPDKPRRLSNLGNSWFRRFERLGELPDVEKAIEYQSLAVKLTPDGHPDTPSRLNSLGSAWYRRFERLGELPDVEKAIEYQSLAVKLTTDGHPDTPSRLNNLGSSWLTRFERLGELADVEKAIEYQSLAVQLASDGHPDKPACLNNLGSSWYRRFERLGELADMEKAIECQSLAVQLSPEGHAILPHHLGTLGNLWVHRFQQSDLLPDLEHAIMCFKTGAEHPITNPGAQIKCARHWGRCMTVAGLSPLPAFHRAFSLIPRLAWLGLTIQTRYTTLMEVSSLATEAAAWAMGAGYYDLAIEWLEQGRSVVWSQTLQLRTPFEDLATVHPELASRFKWTASELETAGSRTGTAESNLNSRADLQSQAVHHCRLATQWDQLLTEVHQLDGFHEYLLPTGAQVLKKAAKDGPIVIINAHRSRCDALIILPQNEDVLHVPLDRLSLEQVADTREQFASMIGHRGPESEARSIHYHKPMINEQDQFLPLSLLWSNLVEPIFHALGYTQQSERGDLPHVTWCAVGALAFLPLHAAGSYNGLSPGTFDLVVSSYTPTLSVLLGESSQAATLQSGLLAVGQATTRGQPALPKTVEELEIIKKHAKGSGFHQLDGALATVDATLDAMERHSWVHLACHATQNRANPSHSAFYLHDGALTLEQIAKRSFKNKGLAFLSACQTATGDDGLPDEATHLASGMLMAGHPSVIATMWSIMDEDAPEIANHVYGELMKDGKLDHTNAARALHKAVGKLREKVGVEQIDRWAPFIHVGA